MRTATRRRAVSASIAVLILCLFPGSAFSEKGLLNFSVWNRSMVYRNNPSQTNSYETIFHLDFYQNITNFGAITAWTDGLLSKGNGRLSQGTAAWNGFRVGGLTFGLNVGDGYFQNTNLESRFINLYHQPVYYRGGSAALTSRLFDLTVYGGKIAQLTGLLGSTYDVKDQPFYGLKARWKFGSFWTLGGGILRTENQRDYAGFLTARKNDVLLADSEMTIVPGAKVLGEFRRSIVDEPSGKTSTGNDYRFGPMIKLGRWDFEANYRFRGSGFRDLTAEGQIFRDEQGLFSSLRFRAARWLTLFGIVDRSKDNVDRDPSRNVTNAVSVTSGFYLNAPSFIDFSFHYDYDKRKSESKIPGYFDSESNGVFLQASKTLGSFYPYVRLRWQRTEDHAHPGMSVTFPTYYLGFRQGLRTGSYLWIEGELNQRLNASNREIDRNVIVRSGLNYSFSSHFDVYAELFYERYGVQSFYEQIEAFLGLKITLFRDTTLRVDLRAIEPLNGKNRPSTYQVTMRFNKRFSWGAAPRVLGRYGFGGPVGVGTVDGYVFEDRNRNGVMDPGEKGLSGIPLRLEDGSTVLTNAEGRYRFSNVAEGPHQIKIEDRSIPATLFILSPTQVNVMVEPRVTRQVQFLMISGASLSGRFIEDTNRNGKIDKDDKGLADILVILTPIKKEGEARPQKQIQDMILNTYTNADGAYLFDNILPGEYELSVDEETLPKGAKVSVTLPVKIKLEPNQRMEGVDYLVNPRPIIIRKYK